MLISKAPNPFHLLDLESVQIKTVRWKPTSGIRVPVQIAIQTILPLSHFQLFLLISQIFKDLEPMSSNYLVFGNRMNLTHQSNSRMVHWPSIIIGT